MIIVWEAALFTRATLELNAIEYCTARNTGTSFRPSPTCTHLDRGMDIRERYFSSPSRLSVKGSISPLTIPSRIPTFEAM